MNKLPIWTAVHVPSLDLLPEKLIPGRAYFIDSENYIIIDHGNGPVIYGGKAGPQGQAGEPLPILQAQIDSLAQASITHSELLQRLIAQININAEELDELKKSNASAHEFINYAIDELHSVSEDLQNQISENEKSSQNIFEQQEIENEKLQSQIDNNSQGIITLSHENLTAHENILNLIANIQAQGQDTHEILQGQIDNTAQGIITLSHENLSTHENLQAQILENAQENLSAHEILQSKIENNSQENSQEHNFLQAQISDNAQEIINLADENTTDHIYLQRNINDTARNLESISKQNNIQHDKLQSQIDSNSQGIITLSSNALTSHERLQKLADIINNQRELDKNDLLYMIQECANAIITLTKINADLLQEVQNLKNPPKEPEPEIYTLTTEQGYTWEISELNGVMTFKLLENDPAIEKYTLTSSDGNQWNVEQIELNQDNGVLNISLANSEQFQISSEGYTWNVITNPDGTLTFEQI